MVVRPLKGHGAFNDVLRSGRRVTSGPLSLTAIGSLPSSQTLTVRCGVTVGKNTARKAVVRNRIKRLLREALRFHVPAKGSRIANSGIHSMVLIWRNAPSSPKLISLDDVRTHVGSAIDRAIDAFRSTN